MRMSRAICGPRAVDRDVEGVRMAGFGYAMTTYLAEQSKPYTPAEYQRGEAGAQQSAPSRGQGRGDDWIFYWTRKSAVRSSLSFRKRSTLYLPAGHSCLAARVKFSTPLPDWSTVSS